MRKLAALFIFIVVISPPTFQRLDAQGTTSQSPVEKKDATGDDLLSPESIQQKLETEGPIDADDIAAASSWVGSTGVADWLGPLAPVALSPFFGVTCLSGLALWGPSWISDNRVLGAAGPLGHEWLFVLFVCLTLLTSVPRLTKVSKPFAQAVDRLETYSVIIILLAIKLVMSIDSPADGIVDGQGLPVAHTTLQMTVVQFGVISFTLDTLLSIAMVINILVINSVKFFFEFLVWLTPIPFLDAVFEVCNKSLSAMLMAIYAYSPTLATAINLVLLFIAALILRWIGRRVRFYRTIVLDPILARLWAGFGKPKRPELIVFPQSEIGPFQAKSRLRLSGNSSGWSLSEPSWIKKPETHLIAPEQQPKCRRGWIMHTIEVLDDQQQVRHLKFSRRYDEQTLKQLLMDLGVAEEIAEEIAEQDPRIEFT